MENEAKKIMKQPRKQSKSRNSNSEEVTSLEWEVIQISEQEEDLIHRMHRLVGDRFYLFFVSANFGVGFDRRTNSRTDCSRNREVLDIETWLLSHSYFPRSDSDSIAA